MPTNNNAASIPPLRAILDIDARPWEIFTQSMELADRVLPNIEYRLFSAAFLMRTLADDSDRFVRNLESIGNFRLTGGGGGGYTPSIPIRSGGNVNVQFPDEFDEAEGFIERDVQFREFLTGSDYPGFFSTFLGRSLLFGGAASTGFAGAQFLPGSLTNLVSDSIRDDNIKEQVKQGTLEAYREWRQERQNDGSLESRATQAFEEAQAFGDDASSLPSPGLTYAAGRGALDGYRAVSGAPGYVHFGFKERLSVMARGIGEAIPAPLRQGFGLTSALHAAYYWSPEDYAYAQENNVSLMQASLRRSIPNSVGAADFNDFFTGRETGVPFLLPSRGTRRAIGDFFKWLGPSPAGAMEYGDGSAGQGPYELGGISSLSNIFNETYRDYLGSLSDTGYKYIVGTGYDPEPITDRQSLVNAINGLRINRVSRNIGTRDRGTHLEAALAIQGPGALGRASGSLLNQADTARQLSEVYGTDSEAGKFFKDIADDATRLSEEIDKLTSDKNLGFFDNLSSKASKAEERMEGLAEASRGIGDAIGAGVGNAIVDFDNLDQIAKQVLEEIRNQLLQLFIIKPISNIASDITSSLIGSLGISIKGNAGGGLMKNSGMNYNEHGPEFLVSAGPTARHLSLLESINDGTYKEPGPNITVVQNFGDRSRMELVEIADVIESRTKAAIQKEIKTYGTDTRSAVQDASRRA